MVHSHFLHTSHDFKAISYSPFDLLFSSMKKFMLCSWFLCDVLLTLSYFLPLIPSDNFIIFSSEMGTSERDTLFKIYMHYRFIMVYFFVVIVWSLFSFLKIVMFLFLFWYLLSTGLIVNYSFHKLCILNQTSHSKTVRFNSEPAVVHTKLGCFPLICNIYLYWILMMSYYQSTTRSSSSTALVRLSLYYLMN